MPTIRASLFGCLAVCATGAFLALAGPLDPPQGPIASTYKTLTEVEPRIVLSAENTPGDANSVFRITKPGSYCLADNLTVPANRHGIEIAAGRVSIDLRGFEIVGNNGSLSGITADGGLAGISVESGRVRGLGSTGIDLGGADACRLRAVHAMENGGTGISIGDGAVVMDCTASANSGHGIGSPFIAASVVLEACQALGNGNGGIVASGVIRACIAKDNTGIGIYSSAGSIIDCHARDNGGDGIKAESFALVSACSASGNGGVGILAISSTVRDSTSASNGGAGISVTTGGHIQGCTSRDNAGAGVTASLSTIADCSVVSNAEEGVRAISSCHVLDVNASANGDNGIGAGILITGSGNRIEGNQVVGNDSGIQVDGSDNVIVRNTARGNTNGNFVFNGANNDYGLIITNAGANFSSSNPWANFQY